MTIQKIIFTFSMIFTIQATAVCVDYAPQEHVEYNSNLSVEGYLRLNAFFTEVSEDLKPFESMSLVLVSAVDHIVQLGEWGNPTACRVNEFTLHLQADQLQLARELMLQGREVKITGRVGMAESSIEEYDNAVLKDVVIFAL